MKERPPITSRGRLVVAIVVLLLNLVPFVLAPALGERMNLLEIAFGLATIPASLAVVFLARDPVRFLVKAFFAGLVILAIGLALREGGKKLVEIGERMNAEAAASP